MRDKELVAILREIRELLGLLFVELPDHSNRRGIGLTHRHRRSSAARNQLREKLAKLEKLLDSTGY